MTREALVFYAVVGGACALCALVLAIMGVKRLLRALGRRGAP